MMIMAGDMALLEVLLEHLYAARVHVARVGMVQTLSYILLLLSGRRDFAVTLNHTMPTGSYSGTCPLVHTPVHITLNHTMPTGSYSGTCPLVHTPVHITLNHTMPTGSYSGTCPLVHTPVHIKRNHKERVLKYIFVHSVSKFNKK
jgi:hypothetical protein